MEALLKFERSRTDIEMAELSRQFERKLQDQERQSQHKQSKSYKLNKIEQISDLLRDYRKGKLTQGIN